MITAAYLGLSNDSFSEGQYFHPKRQYYNGLDSLFPVHGTDAQVKFIRRTHG
jgi:hypothetical protein